MSQGLTVFWTATQWLRTGTHDFSQDESQDSPKLFVTKSLLPLKPERIKTEITQKLMVLKYAFKLFSSNVSLNPPTSNSIHWREKCFKYNCFSSKIIQSLCGTVVKDLISFVGDSEGVSSNPVKAILYNLVLFFFFVVFDHFLPIWLVSLYSHCRSFKTSRILR